MACIFCTEPSASGTIVFEDDRGWVILHDDWAVPGHAMIVSKRHVENPSDLDVREWEHFARMWHRAERVLLARTGAQRAIAMKLGVATPHLHVHLYPVPASATRDDIFAAIDMKTRVARDDDFVAAVRRDLTAASD